MYFLVRSKVASIRRNKALPYVTGSVLDIGCGDGALHNALPEHKYLGIDIVKNGLPLSIFKQIDIETDQREAIKGQYNTIVMLAFLEHLNNPLSILHWCYSRLHNNGNLVLTTPTARGDWIIKNIFHLEVGHKHIYNRGELYQLTKQAHFTIAHYEQFELSLNQLLICKKEGI